MVWVIAAAHAATQGALGVAGSASTATTDVAGSGRLRFGSGVQLGVGARGQDVRKAYVDGFPVTGGALAPTLGVTLPLTAGDTTWIDLEVELGARRLWAGEARSTTAIADLSPMVTFAVREGTALRLGWVHVLHQQISPSVALDAQGALLRVGLVGAAGRDVQWTLSGRAGGLIGYDGDGGKFLAQTELGLRWVPGAARTWLDH